MKILLLCGVFLLLIASEAVVIGPIWAGISAVLALAFGVARITRCPRRPFSRWLAWHLPHRCPEPFYHPLDREMTDREWRQVERYFEHSCPKRTVVVTKNDFTDEDYAD